MPQAFAIIIKNRLIQWKTGRGHKYIGDGALLRESTKEIISLENVINNERKGNTERMILSHRNGR